MMFGCSDGILLYLAWCFSGHQTSLESKVFSRVPFLHLQRCVELVIIVVSLEESEGAVCTVVEVCFQSF